MTALAPSRAPGAGRWWRGTSDRTCCMRGSATQPGARSRRTGSSTSSRRRVPICPGARARRRHRVRSVQRACHVRREHEAGWETMANALMFGLFGLHRGRQADPETLGRRARLAESAGFESVWVGDHISLPMGAQAFAAYPPAAAPRGDDGARLPGGDDQPGPPRRGRDRDAAAAPGPAGEAAHDR